LRTDELNVKEKCAKNRFGIFEVIYPRWTDKGRIGFCFRLFTIFQKLEGEDDN